MQMKSAAYIDSRRRYIGEDRQSGHGMSYDRCTHLEEVDNRATVEMQEEDDDDDVAFPLRTRDLYRPPLQMSHRPQCCKLVEMLIHYHLISCDQASQVHRRACFIEHKQHFAVHS